MSKRENDGELSKEQWNVLSALERLCEENAYPPTVAELAERLKMRTSSIQNCLNRLIELGHVRKNPGKARGLEVVRKLAPRVFTLVAIPIMGEVARYKKSATGFGLRISVQKVVWANTTMPLSMGN